jgi:hypothetical protein
VSEEECYKLNQAGKKARDELLSLLKITPRTTGKLKGTFNVDKIKNNFFKTSLARDKSLTPLLNQTDETRAVSLKIIQQFFLILLERVASNRRQEYNSKRTLISINLSEELKHNPIVSSDRLNEYLIRYIDIGAKAKDNWKFPIEDLLEEVIITVLPEKRLDRQNNQKPLDLTKIGNNNKIKHENILQSSVPSRVKIDREIVDLFWNLDYKQERTFEDALEQNTQCASFSIAAPCEITQKWILNRLMRQIPNIDDALIIPAINLSRNPIRHNFNLFWEELSIHLQTEPMQDAVIRELCYMDVDYPIILIIYNFQETQDAQRNIAKYFWKSVNQEIVNSNKRTEGSRLILFFVDRCSPVYTSNQIIDLAPLQNITSSDVRAWLHKPVVLNWWQSQFERNFANDLISECFNKKNNSSAPRSILDQICLKFGLENGIVEIEESWKWTL